MTSLGPILATAPGIILLPWPCGAVNILQTPPLPTPSRFTEKEDLDNQRDSVACSPTQPACEAVAHPHMYVRVAASPPHRGKAVRAIRPKHAGRVGVKIKPLSQPVSQLPWSHGGNSGLGSQRALVPSRLEALRWVHSGSALVAGGGAAGGAREWRLMCLP
jgi:hypothetical protein